MKSVDVKVKALVTFSDGQSPIGLRKVNEEFVMSKERADYLNGLNKVPLVVILEEVETLSSGSVSELVSEAVSEVAKTRKPRKNTSKESE